MIITRINADLRCLLKVAAIGLVFLAISAQAEAQEPRRAMLRVAGAEQELHTNILAHTAGINLACDAPRTRINAIIPRLSRQVTRAARALGFYHLQESIRIERDLDTDIEACWVISIDVEPGPRITVASVSVTVVQNQQYFSKELDGLSMQAGDALNQESFERIKGQLNSIAVEQVYLPTTL
jgi:translocation and assembly module TamA